MRYALVLLSCDHSIDIRHSIQSRREFVERSANLQWPLLKPHSNLIVQRKVWDIASFKRCCDGRQALSQVRRDMSRLLGSYVQPVV